MMKAQNAQPRPYTYEDVIDVDREFADFVESVSLSKEELAAFVDMLEPTQCRPEVRRGVLGTAWQASKRF
jgi:hypothetical protein